MLQMSRCLYTSGNFSKIFGKNEGNLGTLFTIMIRQINVLVQTYYLLTYIMQLLFARLASLHSENVNLYRNGKFSKTGLFSIFLYSFAINCVTPGARKMPIEYMFCFINSKQ